MRDRDKKVQMKYKITFIAFLLVSFATSSFAQHKNAYGSEKGIYVLNTMHAANKKYPYKNGVCYLIERSTDSKAFTKVNTYSTPLTINEFVERANAFKQVAPYQIDINQDELISAWAAYSKNPDWDSIKHHLSFNYVAAGFGIITLDSSVVKGKKYVYRISLLDKDGKSIESFLTNAAASPEKMTYSPPGYYKQSTDGVAATIIWQSTDERVPHHFKIYRAGSVNGEFSELAVSRTMYRKNDTLFYAFTDVDMNKGVMYRYYISPSNNYGNYNVRSDTALATNLLAKDADLPTNLSAMGIDSLNAIRLSWKIPASYELDAIEVYRGVDYEKPFDKIISLSPAETTYLDRTIASGRRYFYYLKVIDRLGRSSVSTNKVFAICEAAVKPVPPVKTIAKAGEKGVTIYWLPNGDNIRGFYVYRCEGIDGDYSQISSFIDFNPGDTVPSYIDADENMRPGISYSYIVKQESNSYVLSDASNAAIVQPLHVKAKAELPMVYLGSSVINRGILLTWNLDISVYGIYGVQVLRKKAGEQSFSKINKAILDVATTNYIDSTAEKNVLYKYCLSFTNKQNEELSKTNIVSITIEDLALAPPFNLQGEFVNNQVKLSWESSSKNATGFKIYRRTPGKLPVEIGKVGSSVFTFTDSKPGTDDVVFYYITSINDVAESSPGNSWQLIKQGIDK